MSKTSSKNPLLDSLSPTQRKQVIYLEEVDIYLLAVDPKTLDGNPKNWRVHTQRQRSTYRAFKDKYGILAFPIYNLQTKRLIDGHMRVEEAIKEGQQSIVVILKYLTEQEENEVLATFDNIGLLAKRDNEALKALTAAAQENLKKITTKQDQRIAQLTKDLAEVADNGPSILLPQSTSRVRNPKPAPEEAEDDSESPTKDTYIPPDSQPIVDTYINGEVFFEGTSWIGIPLLRQDRITEPSGAPTRTYARDSYGLDAYYCISSGPFTTGETIGTLGFYTEDHRFEDAYTNPESFASFLQELDPASIITPDFSTYGDWPTILSLYNVYRSRWCGRFWQELGFSIIPSIQTLPKDSDIVTYILETLPDECPILSIQCRMADVEGIIDFVKLIVSVRKPEVLLLYGGEEKQKYLHGYLPKKIDYRYLMQYTEKRRRLRKKGIK